MNDDDHAMMNGPRIAQSLPEEYMKALIKATSNTPPLFRADWKFENGMRSRVKSKDLFVWAVVHTESGEVDMTDLTKWEDGQYSLGEGYEWRKFRLVPESESPKP